MVKAQEAEDGLPRVVVRPSVLRVRVLWAVAPFLLISGVVVLLGGAASGWFSVVMPLFLLPMAYSTGVSRLEVGETGVRRRDSWGRTHEWPWQQVRAVEIRDFNWRRPFRDQGDMTLVDHEGREFPLVAASGWPHELQMARKAVAVRARAMRLPLLDKRSHVQSTKHEDEAA